MRKLILYFKGVINNEKDKIVVKNILGAFFTKGCSLILTIFTMPAYIRYFDNQIVLGLWFTILSVMSWIFSFDLGIGNGLRNKLVGALISGNKTEQKKYISSAYIMMTIITGILIIFWFIISPLINWNSVFNIESSIISYKTLLYTTRLIFCGIALQLFLNLISSVLYALQKSAINNLIALVVSAAQLMFVLVAPRFEIEMNLKILSIAFILCTNIPLLIASFIIFGKSQLKNCKPSLKYFSKKTAISILKLGGIFLWAQTMWMLIIATNEFFITQFTRPEYVVEYQIYNKIFTIIGTLFMLALTPLWSAITVGHNEKDVSWLMRTNKRIKCIAFVAIGCELIIIPLLQFVFNIWLGENTISVNYIYAFSFTIYGSIYLYVSAISVIACGMGKMKMQAIYFTIAVFIKFIAVYIGMKIYDNWIVVILANSLILLPYCILQPKYTIKDIKKLDDIN